jgi:tetratricopeptide (TPR) repeat protein
LTDTSPARDTADRDAAQAAALLALGESSLLSGELGTARAHFEAVERLLKEASPQPGTMRARADALRGRAVSHLLAGEVRYACLLLEAALQAAADVGVDDPDILLLLHTASISPYMDLGAYARAAQAAELALSLVPAATDRTLVARAHRSVARTLIAAGRIDEAEAHLGQAQELCEELRLPAEQAQVHWMRGYLHAQSGALEKAERELRTAHEMLVAARAGLFTVQVEVELADVLRRRGKGGEAEELLRRQLDQLNPWRGAVHAGGAHRLLGLIAEERDDTEAAEEHYVTALAMLERAGAAGDLADICRLLGDLLRRTGRIEAALDAYRTGLGHRAAIGTTTLGPRAKADPSWGFPRTGTPGA